VPEGTLGGFESVLDLQSVLVVRAFLPKAIIGTSVNLYDDALAHGLHIGSLQFFFLVEI